jgi:hypothetical protein
MRATHSPALACTVIACTLIASCASVDQGGFEREVRSLIQEGMPAFEAIPNLQRAGFQCSPNGANPPTFTCGRMRQPFAPYTCLEKVSFVDTLENHGAIAALKLEPIACAGL